MREMYRLFRQNVLSVFDTSCFEQLTISTTILTRRIFICNSPATVRYAFVDKAATFARKSAQLRHGLEPVLGDGLLVSDGPTWQARRDAVAPALVSDRLHDVAPTMAAAATEMRDRWMALPPGTAIDVLAEMHALSAEMFGRVLFGATPVVTAALAELVAGFADYRKAMEQGDIVSLLGLPGWMPRLQGRAITRAAQRVHAAVDALLAARDATPSVSGLLRPRLDGAALRNEMATLFMAAHQPTACLMAWAFYLISQSPVVAQRVAAEIGAVAGQRAPRLPDLPRLAYLRAVLDETNRLYPPVPFLAREAQADETILNKRVTKGTTVMVVPWLLHRHRRLWEKPDHFIPERFVQGAPASPDAPIGPIRRNAFLPFSTGPRDCPGAAFGMTAAMLGMATLLQAATLQLRPGHTVEASCRFILQPGDALPMTVAPHGPIADEATPAAG